MITFWKGNVGESVVAEFGTLDDLATRVGEMATAFWDRDCGDVELAAELRFVCASGTWRAFTGESDHAVAEWDPAANDGLGRWVRFGLCRDCLGQRGHGTIVDGWESCDTCNGLGYCSIT